MKPLQAFVEICIHLSRKPVCLTSLSGFHVKHGVPVELVRVFEEQLELWGVSLEPERTEALALYAEKLGAHDRANVVGTRDIGRLWLDHVLDSLSCLLYEPLRRANSLVDVGAGGGMPGIPLHLAVGFGRVCLLESTGKKAEFLRYAVSGLEVGGVEVVNRRAEEIGHSGDYRANFEAATVRAVAPLDVISEYCLPHLKPGGLMIAMKGRVEGEERRAGEKAVGVLGGEIETVVQVPFSEEIESKYRHLIVIRKVRHTPDHYPRKPGTPRKSSLGAQE